MIIRTAAEGVSEKSIARDLRFLERLWQTVERRLETLSAPAIVYSEAELAMRIVRDLLSEDFTQVLVDDEELLRRLNGFLQATAPELADRVSHYQGTKPLFETYGIDEEIRKALARRVDLPSGGYLVIDHTEAMTVIDVNTGRYVGRKHLEDTILKTNLEACTRGRPPAAAARHRGHHRHRLHRHVAPGEPRAGAGACWRPSWRRTAPRPTWWSSPPWAWWR